jgi:MFS family permease
MHTADKSHYPYRLRHLNSLYYGWRVTLALAITQMTSWGILYYAFPIILIPLQHEMQWDQGVVTGAFSLAILVSGVAAVPVGRCLDRYGAWLIMTLGSCLSVMLVCAWSQVTTLVGFYIIWLLIGVAMSATLYAPAFTVVAHWFTQKRSEALTIVTLGGGLASVIYVPLTEWLADRYGWRISLMLLAGILALITIPLHASVLRRRPTNEDLSAEGSPAAEAQATRRSEPGIPVQGAVKGAIFWGMTAAFSLSTFMSVAITVYLVPYLTNHGLPAAFAAAMLGLLGGSQIPGRLLFASLDRWFARRLLVIGLFGMQILAMVILILAPTRMGISIFAILFGSAAGAGSPARAILLADIYGPEHYGSINGIQTFSMTLVGSLAPVGIGVLCGVLHTYQLVPWMLVVAAVAALGAMLGTILHRSYGMSTNITSGSPTPMQQEAPDPL